MPAIIPFQTGRRHRPSAGWSLVFTTAICLLFALLAMLLGFPHHALQAQSQYKEIQVSNGGSISGTVRLAGESHKADAMQMSKDQTTCGKQKSSPRLELGKNNCIKNAVVYLEGITEGRKLDKSGTFVVDQEGCEYTPHISIVPQGAQLVITNSDPILHNVHAYDEAHGRQTAFNIAQPIRGQKTVVKQAALAKCGEQISLTCDAGHPWMSGYIFSASHPYYAVTDKDGHFQIDDIPPGTYKVVMWHEGVDVSNKEMDEEKVKKYLFEEPYIIAKDATVPANGKATVEFELKLR